MRACLFRYVTLLLSCVYLSACTTTHTVPPTYRFAATAKNRGFAALAITCQGIATGTRNTLLMQEAQVSFVGKIFSADTISSIPLHCNPEKPYYTLQALPPGTYYLTGIQLGNTRALCHVTFHVLANQITYVGRLHIIATQPITMKNITFNTVNPGVMQFELSNQATVDIAYFKGAYPNSGAMRWVTYDPLYFLKKAP